MEEQRRFEARIDSVREARTFVRALAAETGADPAMAELLASELATNALLHAQSPFEIRVRRQLKALRVEVVDGRPELRPAKREPSPEGGRGLAIVDGFAQAWGTESGPDYKAVWFELPAS